MKDFGNPILCVFVCIYAQPLTLSQLIEDYLIEARFVLGRFPDPIIIIHHIKLKHKQFTIARLETGPRNQESSLCLFRRYY